MSSLSRRGIPGDEKMSPYKCLRKVGTFVSMELFEEQRNTQGVKLGGEERAGEWIMQSPPARMRERHIDSAL